MRYSFRSGLRSGAHDGAPSFIRLWLMRHALQQSQLVEEETALPPSEYMRIGGLGAQRYGQKSYFRSTQLLEPNGWAPWPKPKMLTCRFVAIALFAVAAVSLTPASARAFSQENGGARQFHVC